MPNLIETAERIAKAHEGSAYLARDILLALEEVRRNALADVPQRLAAHLLQAFDAHHGAGELVLPQEHIAKDIGATRSYVSTLITEWKTKRIIRAVGRKMFLENRRALEKLTRAAP